jgi:regulator of protease activity HflC (stomatin/prohibitin superfamily)
MVFIAGFMIGVILYSIIRVLITGFYTVRPNERAVISSFGKAERLGNQTVGIANCSEEEQKRYVYPQLQVVKPGGPYFKWPWQKVHKVEVATQTADITWDPSKAQNTIEAVTKDNLTTGVNGQIRYRVCENNLYAYFFGVESPLEHVMGFFVSVLRERIANFTDPKGQSLMQAVTADGAPPPSTEDTEMTEGVSINDLRKNLPLLNEYMEQQCQCTAGRYGIELDAALVTEIDPPPEVDRALSAINSTRNQVAADISTARADAEQQITMSKRAVEIAMNNARAEVAPLREMANTLEKIKKQGGSNALRDYVRNMKIPLLSRARQIIQATPGVLDAKGGVS